MTKESLYKASSILLILFVASRVLGFVREQIIAALLGTSIQADAFVVAATIPFTFSYIIGVAAGNALLPVYTGRLQSQDRIRLASTVLYAIGALVAVLTGLGMIFTAALVDFLAPGFTGQARELALLSTRIMLPSTLFLTLGFVAKAVLNAHREFAVPAWAPVWQNIIFIVLIIPFGSMLGPGLAWCTLAGAVVFYLYNVPSMGRVGVPVRPLLNLGDPDVRRVLLMAVPVIITTLVNRGFIFLDRWFGSHLVEGSIAALNFANRVRELPYGLFVAVVSTVLFPALAAAVSNNDMPALRERAAKGLRLVGLVTYPCAALLMILPAPVVRLLFERGAFGPAATEATATALAYYAVSVTAMSAVSVLTYTFLSLREVMLPLWVGVAGLTVNVVLDYLLVGPMGHDGLALGNTAGFVVTAILMLVFLHRRLPEFPWRRQASEQLKIMAASLVFAVVLYFMALFTGLFEQNSSPIGQLAGITLASGTAGIVYLLMLFLFNQEDVVPLKQRLFSKGS
ncbi:MAG: murein biosynthesis integral membrane protein MurJ [Firmicutes bacterium]|nr:murein biosynthesis integral membrane protein MurJ [Bacillota bacterium]